jgi:nitroreductase
MDVYEALYTTRAMRRVKTDPIPLDTQARILDAAVRAPSGGNSQGWRFLLLDDPAIRAELGPLYRDCIRQLFSGFYKEQVETAQASAESPEGAQMLRVFRSAQHLADHFEDVPLFLFAFVAYDTSGGSIYQAVWSAQLAARAEGVGSALTTVLGVFYRDKVFELLGIPADEGWQLACTVSFGYPTGRWGVAPRRPAHDVSYRNRWGEPVGFEVPEPLWKG